MKTAITVTACVLLATAAKAATVFDCDTAAAPELREWTETELKPKIEKWYAVVSEELAEPDRQAPRRLRLRYRDDMNGTPAWTSGDEISLNHAWFAKERDREAVGCVAHELVHVVQRYPAGVPGWFTEGFADYMRWFRFEPEKHGAVVRWDDPKVKFDAGYRVSACFLDWVARSYGEKALLKFNAAARGGRLTDDVWREVTGKTAAELGAEWKATEGRLGSLESRIAAEHKILASDSWGGGHRVIFEFEGHRAWLVEPKQPRSGRPWVWTMQWMGAYLNRSGIPQLMERGFCHVHLEAFDTKADEAGLGLLARYQEYLVGKLGLAPKANLLGMSWGGFYSIRYAAAHPRNVARIMLDAPLLNFSGFAETRQAEICSWARNPPKDGNWSTDPRMPVNQAGAIAEAGIPVYLLYGGSDSIVVPKLNCELFAERFKAAGGNLRAECRGLYGHHPHGFEHEDLDKAIRFYEGR